jgi:hypothetical protein
VANGCWIAVSYCWIGLAIVQQTQTRLVKNQNRLDPR